MAKVDTAVVHRLLADRLKGVITSVPVIEMGQARESDAIVIDLNGLTLTRQPLGVADDEPVQVGFQAVVEVIADAAGAEIAPFDRLTRLIGSVEAALYNARLTTLAASGAVDCEVLPDDLNTSVAVGATPHGASVGAQLVITGVARRFAGSSAVGGAGGGGAGIGGGPGNGGAGDGDLGSGFLP